MTSAGMDELFRCADAAVAKEHAGAVKRELMRLEALCSDLSSAARLPERLKALYRCTHDIRGLGGAVGYPLLTAVAGSLCLLLDRMMQDRRPRIPPIREAAIAMHVRKLRQIHDEGLVGTGGEAGARLVAGLRAVAEKASA